MSEESEPMVLLLSGNIASGKTTLARLLHERHGFKPISTRALLEQNTDDRRALQAAGEALEMSTRGKWLADGLEQIIADSLDNPPVVVDAVRTLRSLHWLKVAFGSRTTHIHLIANLSVLTARYSTRGEGYIYDEIKDHPIEGEVGMLAAFADQVIDTGRLEPERILERVVFHLR